MSLDKEVPSLSEHCAHGQTTLVIDRAEITDVDLEVFEIRGRITASHRICATCGKAL